MRASQQDYIVTVNNPTTQLQFYESNVSFAIWQLERGESGTEHFQLYIEFRKPTSIIRGREILGVAAHFEGRRGSVLQAIQYCSKSDTRVSGPWRFGDPRVQGQGHRSDIDSAAKAVADGASLVAIASETPGLYVRFYRGLSALQAALHRPRWRTVRCFFLCGPPGSGKTSLVYEAFEGADVYALASDEPLWADGYTGQRVLLVDDVDAWSQRKAYLRILDGHPCQLPVKGGFVWAQYDTVIVANNTWDVDSWSPALRRRFDSGGLFWVRGERGSHGALADYIRGVGCRPEGYDRSDMSNAHVPYWERGIGQAYSGWPFPMK